jgi:phospholipase C
MDTRRDFLKKAALLTGATGLAEVLPASIKRAAAINPPPGSSYLDAEHVVILMQENRSFDHCFGSLRGVRGFNDPRAMRQPTGEKVWLQRNEKGEAYLPFRFDIRNTKATWMGSVPHSRSSQVDANNLGRYDNWLPAKRVRNKKFAEMPLTMGHYTREDIPFYYAMADAFTVGDQNFCSGMTCTRPNRLFFWTGTIREKQNGKSKAHLRNEDEGYGTEHWMTYPERLEKSGISWKFYQNDIDCGGGFTGTQRAWLSNFGCNPLEWFSNFNVKFTTRYARSLQRRLNTLPGEISDLEQKIKAASAGDTNLDKMKQALAKKQQVLRDTHGEIGQWTEENYQKLSPKEKSLFQRAFSTNAGDPDYHELATLSYKDGTEDRSLEVPKGDVLYEFRKDVESGKLPTVSWLAGSQNFSDHPSAPWYGSLYVSEILDILTQNPEVWKKTIFIITFDENDGYFDHVTPFVSPDPDDPLSGKVSSGIDIEVEYVRRSTELAEGVHPREARSGPLGLGFRVPLIIASPWTRGGRVCSQIFDHTSTLQFLEQFLKGKYGKDVRETQISDWRRMITGDLTSAFREYHAGDEKSLPFLQKDPFIEKIYNAKFRKAPTDYTPVPDAEARKINRDPGSSSLMPRQEKGVRPSAALAYELYADGTLSADKKQFTVSVRAADKVFGTRALGAPFNVFTIGKYAKGNNPADYVGSRTYSVRAGDELSDDWNVAGFESGRYELDVQGPNGFYRCFQGSAKDPALEITCDYERGKSLTTKLTGNIVLNLKNLDAGKTYTLKIRDQSYGNPTVTREIKADGTTHKVALSLDKSRNWYDISVTVEGYPDYLRGFAGRVETGRDGFTDPKMGGEVA